MLKRNIPASFGSVVCQWIITSIVRYGLTMALEMTSRPSE